MAEISLQALAEHLAKFDISVEIRGDASVQVSRIENLVTARPGSISFVSDAKYLEFLASSQASAVFVKPEQADLCQTNALLVKNPYAAYAASAQLLYYQAPKAGIAPSAVVEASAKIAASAQIAANCVVGEAVEIGENSVIGAGCVLEKGVKIGSNTRLAPNVTVMHSCEIGDDCVIESGTVIGGDGFGFARHNEQWIKIPQIGRVLIGNKVAIANNVAIDRGAIEDTEIGDNCIIDNLVHIAHNVKIGAGTAIAGQVGFAGSAKVGKNCTFAGQAGMVGHIELADGVTIMGRSVATHSIKQAGVYAGFPAVELSEWRKNAVYANSLSKLANKIKDLTKRLNKFDNK